MTNPAKQILRRLGNAYIQKVCRDEYETQDHRVNERPVEFRFVFDQLCRWNVKTVLDVGTGVTALPQVLRTCGYVVTAIDNVRDYWEEDIVNRHYYVLDDDIRNTSLQQTFDVVLCISVLEHIPEHQAAIASMCRLLNPGGHLLLTFPYNEQRYYPNAYALPESDPVFKTVPYVAQIFSRAEVAGWARSNNMVVTTEEYWACYHSDLWTCGGVLVPPRRVTVEDRHHLMCLALHKPEVGK